MGNRTLFLAYLYELIFYALDEANNVPVKVLFIPVSDSD